MPGGRRIPRSRIQTAPTTLPTLIQADMSSTRYSPLVTGAIPTVPGIEIPNTPKHFHFPLSPLDGDLLFETVMFMFTVVAMSLQFLNLYRSVWWLPHSYTSHGMNFYLIDVYIVVFIMVILSRRLVYILGSIIIERLVPVKYFPLCRKIYRLTLFAFILVTLIWCSFYIIQNHPIVNIFYLCYPVSVYLILFGFSIAPMFELYRWSSCGEAVHACSSNATDIRLEVDNLKTDFNNRMKQILFSSVLNAYYAGFVPCCFAQSFLYYDIYWATQHLIFVWLSCFTTYATQLLPAGYCDILHRSAMHLGNWNRIEPRSHLPVTYTWQGNILWPPGALVRHSRELYRAQGLSNAAEPGNTMHSRFHNIFKNPSVPLSGLLGLQVSLVLLQIILLIRCSQWQQIISLALLLFVNYYTLFKLTRDYLLSVKIYKTEEIILEKTMFQ